MKAVMVGGFAPEYVESLDLTQLDRLLDAIDVVDSDRRKTMIVDGSYATHGDDKGVRKHFKALDKAAGIRQQANPADFLEE